MSTPPAGTSSLDAEAPGASAATRGLRWAVLVGVVAGVSLFTALNLWLADYSADELGLGLNTSSVEEVTPAGRLSGDFGHTPELRERVAELTAAGHPVTLWLGASQLHAINDRGPDDHLAVYYADQRAQQRGSARRYVLVSAPNANLHELLRDYLAFRARPSRLPETVVLALTYDDLGETGIRPQCAVLEVEDQPDRAVLVEPEAPGSPGGVDPGAPPPGGLPPEAPAEEAPIARSATADSPQETLEAWLVAGLESVWPGYAARGSLRSWLIVSWKEPLTGALYRLRGRPQQVPAPEALRWNMEALDELIRLTRADGVRLLIYKPPHRPGEARFYHPRADYDAFFAQLDARAGQGVHVLDLEPLVPAQHWGLTNNFLPDVFHFQDAGHRLLGEAIDRWFEQADR